MSGRERNYRLFELVKAAQRRIIIERQIRAMMDIVRRMWLAELVRTARRRIIIERRLRAMDQILKQVPGGSWR